MRTIFSVMVGTDENGDPIYYKEMTGESSETKPKDRLAAGSPFLEVDTGKIMCFSEVQNDYVEEFSLQS